MIVGSKDPGVDRESRNSGQVHARGSNAHDVRQLGVRAVPTLAVPSKPFWREERRELREENGLQQGKGHMTFALVLG
jgi:hypothetical protein